MVKTSSGDRSPLLLKSPRRCCRGGEGFSQTSYGADCCGILLLKFMRNPDLHTGQALYPSHSQNFVLCDWYVFAS